MSTYGRSRTCPAQGGTAINLLVSGLIYRERSVVLFTLNSDGTQEVVLDGLAAYHVRNGFTCKYPNRTRE